MENHAVFSDVEIEDVADVLHCLAALMETFQRSDLALQNALSSLTQAPGAHPNTFQLQHIDLLTQTHCDLARLFPLLAASLRGVRTTHDDLRKAMTLRSLRDALIDADPEGNAIPAGELSLF